MVAASPIPAPATAPAPAPAPTAPPPSTLTVAITAVGMNPWEVTIAQGGRVTFINNDNQPHDIQGGLDPEHRECPEIDVVGFLTPGQSRSTAPLTTVRACDYHDHAFHDVAHGYGGRIIVQ
jgi:plastocyanin